MTSNYRIGVADIRQKAATASAAYNRVIEALTNSGDIGISLHYNQGASDALEFLIAFIDDNEVRK